MKLEQQVCSFELAKRLKELGVKQESLFYWHYELAVNDPVVVIGKGYERQGSFNISAFTVAELGEMLPWDIVIHRDIYKGWHLTFQANGMTEKEMQFSEDSSEADARSKMLIYLLENKLL